MTDTPPSCYIEGLRVYSEECQQCRWLWICVCLNVYRRDPQVSPGQTIVHGYACSNPMRGRCRYVCKWNSDYRICKVENPIYWKQLVDMERTRNFLVVKNQ